MLLGSQGLDRYESNSAEHVEHSAPPAEPQTSPAARCHRESEATNDCETLWIDLGGEG
jgi:hypothetical protein